MIGQLFTKKMYSFRALVISIRTEAAKNRTGLLSCNSHCMGMR